MHDDSTTLDTIPYGYCHCGCGGLAPIAKMTASRFGHVKGEPVRYIKGHHARRLAKGIVGKDIDRFMKKVRLSDSGCWEWQGASSPDGYGHIYWGQRIMPAHRVSYGVFSGAIPDGKVIDHLCRNPRCVNPDHLEPVTHAENMRRGTATKLTADDVATIRSIYVPRSGEYGQQALADKYGVIKQTITDIIIGRSWQDG